MNNFLSFDAVITPSSVLQNPVEIGGDSCIHGGLIACASYAKANNSYEEDGVLVVGVKQRSTYRETIKFRRSSDVAINFSAYRYRSDMCQRL